MSKKNRAHKEISAFESARAALERAGEIDAPEASGKKEGSEPENVSATPETSGNAENETASAVTGTPEASEKPDDAPKASDAPASENKDAAPVSESADANPTASADSATETVSAAPDADTAPQTSDAANVDAPASEPENVSAAPQASENADSGNVSGSGTPEASDETAGKSAPPDADTPPETSERGAESESAFDDGASEVEETERHTMETREITLGRHRTAPPGAEAEKESVKAPKEHSKRSVAQAFEEFKSAVRGRVESAAEEEEERVSVSYRDEAILQRVRRMPDGETKNYLLNRIIPQMTWYNKKSESYQTRYYRLMATTIILGALIPAFSVGANSTAFKVIIALLGASVTGINAYIALYNFHDLWMAYRTTREELLHTLYCYFNRAGVFSQKNVTTEELDVLLVNVCEETLSKENGGWKSIVQMTQS